MDRIGKQQTNVSALQAAETQKAGQKGEPEIQKKYEEVLQIFQATHKPLMDSMENHRSLD